jgi:diguanylate cyclase (GGDEF)-like protein
MLTRWLRYWVQQEANPPRDGFVCRMALRRNLSLLVAWVAWSRIAKPTGKSVACRGPDHGRERLLRQRVPPSALVEATFFVFLVAACYFATHLGDILEPRLVPFAQVAVFASAALLLTASALRRGLRHGSHLAYTDELTRLSNRRAFTETLAAELSARATTSDPLALLLLDLDRFKLVNDTLGHPTGDELLKVVAERLRTGVPAGAFVARLGGDEFAAIVRVHHDREAILVAEDILAALNQAVMLKGQQVWPNASIGVALPPEGNVTSGELLRMADVALYQAKGRGRGRAFVYDSGARLPGIDKLSIESDLHQAIRQGQFEILYQPIVDLASRRIAGVEALLRWNHPSRGVVTPDAFLVTAQESGIGPALAEWIVEEVSEQLRVWHQIFGDRLAASINISAAELQTLDFAFNLGSVSHGASVAGLGIEIAEETLGTPDPVTLANLDDLRDAGFKVAVDNFGSGQMSFSYLQATHLDVLKLAPVFVQAPQDSDRALRIIASIVNLAHALDMTVVAAGIETQEQYERVREAGCEQGQGFYFAYPMTAQALTDLLADDQLTLPLVQRPHRQRRGRQRPWSRGPVAGPAAWDGGGSDQKSA